MARAPPAAPTTFELDAAWRPTGDKRYLEGLYGDEIRTGNQRMYMVTEGHWWSDRVEMFRQPATQRLGGVALKRNPIVPGDRVSWRFDDAADAEQVAILVPGATPGPLQGEAYNPSDQPGPDATGARWPPAAATGP